MMYTQQDRTGGTRAADMFTRQSAPVEAGIMSYLEAGSGPVVLLLHGIPGGAESWRRAGALLAQRFRVIIPDLLGFGSSSVPADPFMEAQARAVGDLLDRLGIGAVFLAAHDFGGPVAVTMMRRFPELRVRALALTATNLFTDTVIPAPLRTARVPVLGWLVFRMMAGSRAGLWMMYRQAVRAKQTYTYDAFRRLLTPACIRHTMMIFRRSLADLESNYRAVQEHLAAIDIPALVFWGDRDPFFAVDVARRTASAIGATRLVVLPETGHFVPEERYEQTAALLEDLFGGQRTDEDDAISAF